MAEDIKETPSVTIKSAIIDYLWSQLKLHGISMLLLAIAVWYFHGENKRMQQEIRSCNQAIIVQYEQSQAKLLEALNNNTLALNRIIREDQLQSIR